MKKICFFTIWREDSETVGINMKIRNQVKAFSNLGYDSYFCVSASSIVKLYHYNRDLKCFDEAEVRHFSHGADYAAAKNKIFRKISSMFRLKECLVFMDSMKSKYGFEFIYIRRIIPFTIGTAVKIKKWSKSSSIYWEIPTWGEKPVSTLNRILHDIENFMYKALESNMQVVAISSGQESKNGVLLINNGVDNDSIPVKKNSTHQGLNLICLATFSHWHGYDRLLNGLKEYYDSFGSTQDKEVNLYMVGNGQTEELIKLTEDLCLGKYVHFEGVLTGKNLDAFFDSMDVAIGNLGFFRKGVLSDTSIKIREYCSRGIPFVTALKINDFPEDYPYIFHVPMDESYIDIRSICEFYASLDVDKATKEMRSYAEDYLTWEQQLKKIF